MNAGHVVLLAFILGIVCFAVADVVAALNDRQGDTLSEMTLKAAKGSLMVPLAVGLVVGVILGHLFWPQIG